MDVAASPPPLADRFALPPEPVLRFTVDQYHEMIRTGILASGAPIELLEGWLVTKIIKSPRHSAATAKTRRSLAANIPDGWSVDTQEPVTTADSEPEPDVSVIRGLRENYTESHPAPGDIGLLVEVADTSVDRDRNWKKRMYAAAGIPVYWVVNLVDRQVEVFTAPSGNAERAEYATHHVFRVGEEVPLVLDGRQVGWLAVSDLLPQ
jgi:Uma2 family endonuclease